MYYKEPTDRQLRAVSMQNGLYNYYELVESPPCILRSSQMARHWRVFLAAFLPPHLWLLNLPVVKPFPIAFIVFIFVWIIMICW